MRHELILIGILPLLFLLTATAHGADEGVYSDRERAIVATLSERGYENVAARVTHDSAVIWCENRRIRFTPEWIVEALTVGAERVPFEMTVRVVAMRHARPISSFEARAEDILAWAEHRMPTAEFRDRLVSSMAGDDHPPERRNSSLGRFDLALGPGRFPAALGISGIWMQAVFDVGARLSTTMAPGVIGSGQMFVPIYVHNGPVPVGSRGNLRNSEIRPGTIAVSYFRPLGQNGFSTVTVGTYELGNPMYDSYGVVLSVREYSPSGRWSFGAQIGSIGRSAYLVETDQLGRYRVWELSWPPNDIAYQAEIGYRVTGVDLSIDGRWGRFVNGDRGWRVDINRRFGEVGVTVFGLRSNGVFRRADGYVPNDTRLLGGLRLEVPLPPRRRSMPSPLRVTTSDSYRWAYRYRVGHVGAGLSTGFDVDDLVGDYNPIVVENNLDRVQPAARAGQSSSGASND